MIWAAYPDWRLSVWQFNPLRHIRLPGSAAPSILLCIQPDLSRPLLHHVRGPQGRRLTADPGTNLNDASFLLVRGVLYWGKPCGQCVPFGPSDCSHQLIGLTISALASRLVGRNSALLGGLYEGCILCGERKPKPHGEVQIRSVMG